MKLCFLTVLYNTPEKEVSRLEKQCIALGFDFYAIDNSGTEKGYAEGINSLLQTHLFRYDIFFIANPDIDISLLNKKIFLDAASTFDIWGYAMKQDGKIYFQGVIDAWRMSGGLSTNKPSERFTSADFVSGSLMAVKKKVFEMIGLLDESYGMYYEDVDFCYRANRMGYKVGIDTENVYTHFEESKKNRHKARFLARNRMRFLWRYGTLQQKIYELVRLPKTLMEDGRSLL